MEQEECKTQFQGTTAKKIKLYLLKTNLVRLAFKAQCKAQYKIINKTQHKYTNINKTLNPYLNIRIHNSFPDSSLQFLHSSFDLFYFNSEFLSGGVGRGKTSFSSLQFLFPSIQELLWRWRRQKPLFFSGVGRGKTSVSSLQWRTSRSATSRSEKRREG